MFLSFNRKKDDKLTSQVSKEKDNRKGLHSSKRKPSCLQFLNVTSLSEVFFSLAILRSQLSNRHSEKLASDRSCPEKLQFLNMQFSYSVFGNPFSRKSVPVKVSSAM